jgi:Uncharacterized protein conserved in bacteria (DUF2188)
MPGRAGESRRDVARNIYRVMRDGRLWVVQIGRRTLGRWRLKDNAVRRAREWASQDEPSLVTVHDADGSIEGEFPYGHDPYPSTG